LHVDFPRQLRGPLGDYALWWWTMATGPNWPSGPSAVPGQYKALGTELSHVCLLVPLQASQ